MKPDLTNMSRKELKNYVLTHRNDLEALHALYERRSPDSEAVWFKAPTTLEDIKQMESLFVQALKEREQKRRDQEQGHDRP